MTLEELKCPILILPGFNHFSATADEFSTKLPVTDLNPKGFTKGGGANSNLHRYKYILLNSL
jgi:hypothetical protein